MAEQDTTAVRAASSDAAVFARTPAFPVLEARIGPGEAVVDGQHLEPENGQGPREAAVAALAARARGLRGEHGSVRARVSSVDADDTVLGAFSAVVTADGAVVDTTGERAERSSPRSRRWLVAALVAGLVLVAGVAVALVAVPGAESRTAAHPVPRAVPTGTPTVLPQRAPRGFSSVARWSAAIANDSRPIVTGKLAVSVTDDAIQAHRLDDGARLWQVGLPSDAQSAATDGGLHLSRVNGRAAVVLAGDEQLHWWPLAGPHHGHAVGLSSDADVSFAGPSPLVTVPGQHARVLDGDRFSDRVVPAGATALAAADQGVVAADTAGHVWWLPASQARFPGKPRQLATPPGAGNKPQVVGMAGRSLVTSWPGKGKQRKHARIVALHDAGTGRVQTAKPVAAGGLSDAQWQSSQVNHEFGAFGDVVIDAGQRSIHQVRGFSADTVLDGLVYGHDEHQHRQTVTADGHAHRAGGDGTPVARSGRWALVTVTTTDTTRLYALAAREAGDTNAAQGSGSEPASGDDGAAESQAPTPTSATSDGAGPQGADTTQPTPTGQDGE